MNDPRRDLPAVGVILERSEIRALAARYPRSVVVSAIRAELEGARRGAPLPATADAWVDSLEARIRDRTRASLRPVLNATGVVLHTNLGRAPLGEAALAAVDTVSRGFSTLEYDAEQGGRGSRHAHGARLLREFTGAEDALIVNNGAAALLLALAALASGREAIISRGELIEIGGSFRVPDIMRASGTELVEVGTTNRTHLADYRAAINDRTATIVKVHRSNFALEGYTAEADVEALAALCLARQIPLIHDLGSGLLLDLTPWGLTGEPTARDAVSAGADLVLMSGDKLLGGPQCGLIVGRAPLIATLRAHPLARALRVDKMTLAALEATLALYRDPERLRSEVPALQMLTASAASVRTRAEQVAGALRHAGVDADVRDSDASVGGGAFPTARIPSAAVTVGGAIDQFEERLRAGEVPVVARRADGRLWLDLRTVLPGDEPALITQLLAATRPG